MSVLQPIASPIRIAPRGAKRAVGIWDLLVWAFQAEKVSLDFDELATVAGERPGVGMEWILLQRHNLGCQVDGGGRSEAHPDADLVASAVACLPEGCGGRRMATEIAELARAGTWPSLPQPGPAKCRPVEWKRCKHGVFAARQFWGGNGRSGRFPENQLGRGDGYYCPVTYDNLPAEAAAVRRHWLLWWGALLELRCTFQRRADLTAFEVTDEMPPRAPWAAAAKKHA